MSPQLCRRALQSSAPFSILRILPRLSPLTSRRHKSGPYGYTQAKALVYSKYGEPKDELSLHTHSISPSLPPNSVLLRTLASPINPADINQIQGTYPSKPPLTALLGTPSPSAVGGNEGCFTVQSVGPSVTTLKPGDWVLPVSTNFGTWRTHAIASTDAVFRVENTDGLSPVQAATVAVNPTTAYRMLKDFVDLREGDWVIQNGANSGVGRAAVQMARRWGLRTINIVRDRADAAETEKLKQEMLELGATKVVTESELMGKEFVGMVKEWTNGGREKVKLALNCVGGKPTSAMVKALADGGHVVTYGGMAKAPLMVGAGVLIFKDIRWSGFWVSRWSNEHPEEKRRTVGEILEWIRQGEFRDVPMQKVDWEWGTDVETLKAAVQGTLEGFRSGKGVFVFRDT